MNQTEIENRFSELKSRLKEELEPDEFEAWVLPLELVSITPSKVELGGMNQFFCNFIKNHHQPLLREKIFLGFESLGLEKDFALSIQVGNLKSNKKGQKAHPLTKVDLDFGFNPKYSFDHFVNGGNSDMAFAAARSVGDNIKSSQYNPLFICGDVGLGKTHLLQAIGLRGIETAQTERIRYATCQEFINEVIEGIRFQKIAKVRAKYRNVDLLLIDDIQFLENKEATQEEFFHLFNDLIHNKKQIVVTSDRYPREIKHLEERLVSRFNSGMVARIYPPDLETRAAIIRDKATTKGLPLSEEIIRFLANTIKSNVRDLEGILVHIEANKSLLGQEITLEQVKRVLKEVLNLESDPKSLENIIKMVSSRFDVKPSDLKSDKRTQEISKPRQIAMYICREATDFSFPAIAEHFGGKNHTTVIQAHKKTKELIDNDPEIRQTINAILREIST
ncbi:MAG: hypothetical protein A2508_06710 [Candidatus Lambdaproteobacteria bacterium RIFOXYD12_FULL_49_8]|uniref:Chromosomal replication initiator protein DnaA n=1 Tax=Candidatus Lambdaproteobacteria bacterium RIFOXYD2_FULL_50_16 TaxID=1817772 RepID=A0A1F6GEF8_9PROT|nr:MAG: hypothetical protein A2527_01895 [Candidatus Lambdaproteobacteria bacterium RIFOXYD2_FULL_50_16]OGG98228.1 MAG: hypothetical protein A2508_06710 [Candidatus Lambdaproteobacteria bacterium RIFOXYD12_FULL_49_8]